VGDDPKINCGQPRAMAAVQEALRGGVELFAGDESGAELAKRVASLPDEEQRRWERYIDAWPPVLLDGVKIHAVQAMHKGLDVSLRWEPADDYEVRARVDDTTLTLTLISPPCED
jgi:hypothetical protein